jgi:hypothetical protein
MSELLNEAEAFVAAAKAAPSAAATAAAEAQADRSARPPAEGQAKAGADDANDYSRFDNVEFSDADADSDDGAAADAALPTTISVPESILQAEGCKEQGNAAFKAAQYVEAKLHYQQGMQLLLPHKALKEPAIGAGEREQLRALLVSLLGNTAMVLMKQENWSGGAKSASSVLDMEAGNVKALFRRGTCRLRMGDASAGRADLQRAVELDPGNAAAKKELQEAGRQLRAQKDKERAAFSGAFKAGSGSMYADREQEAAVKAKKAADAALKEKDDWTTSKLTRRDAGLAEQTFEEWKQAREDERKAADKAAEQAKKAQTQAASPPAPSIPRAPKKTAEATEEDEYDEEDAKLIKEATGKGYCYFRNQLDTETQELIGNITPKALVSAGEPAAAPSSGGLTTSDWNHAGTWEERDFSALVKDRLTTLCSACAHNEAEGEGEGEGERLLCSVKEIKKCEGEAQVVMTRGKKRHLYDYQMDIAFEAALGKARYGGVISFGEVTPGGEYEHAITYKKTIADKSLDGRVRGCVSGLRDAIVTQMRSFEVEYKSM